MTTVVVYEDRPTHWTGVQLTLLSVRSRSPELDVVAHLPGVSDAQRRWVTAFAPGVEVRAEPVGNGGGWNVKPSLLLAELAAGAPEVIWIDTDVLVARPLRPMLDNHPAGALIVAADNRAAPLHGTDHRTRAWGLNVARPVPRSVNSGFLRVLPDHAGVLADWRAMLASEPYKRAQQRPWKERPLHFWGDQEALTALLGSTLAAGVTVSQLRAGVEMAQSQGPRGWTVVERVVAGLRGGPTMVHSMGPKPWLVPRGSARVESGWGVRWWLADAQVRCSPYTRLAWPYRAALGENGAWLTDHPGVSRFNGPRTCGVPGLPLALATSPVALKKPWDDRRSSHAVAMWLHQHGGASPFPRTAS